MEDTTTHRCSTTLVEPPRMWLTVTIQIDKVSIIHPARAFLARLFGNRTTKRSSLAFSNAFRVMMSRGLISRSSISRIAAPARRHSCIFSLRRTKRKRNIILEQLLLGRAPLRMRSSSIVHSRVHGRNTGRHGQSHAHHLDSRAVPAKMRKA